MQQTVGERAIGLKEVMGIERTLLERLLSAAKGAKKRRQAGSKEDESAEKTLPRKGRKGRGTKREVKQV